MQSVGIIGERKFFFNGSRSDLEKTIELHVYLLFVARRRRRRRSGWRALFGIPRDRGRFEPINSRTSFPEVEGTDVEHFMGVIARRLMCVYL